MRLMPTLMLIVLLANLASAQDADRMAPDTRAGEIEAKRQEKSQNLSPEVPTGIERILQVMKEKKVLERITYGVAGVRAHLGGLITGSGFGGGPEYYRRDLLHEQASFRASLRASFRKYYLIDTEFRLPHLASDHAFINLY